MAPLPPGSATKLNHPNRSFQHCLCGRKLFRFLANCYSDFAAFRVILYRHSMFGQVSPRDSICPLCAASKRQHAWHLSASRNDGWSITITLSLAESRATEIREAALHSRPAIISIPEQSSNSRISCRTQKLPYYCKKNRRLKRKC